MFLREAGAGARKGQQSEQEVNNVGESEGMLTRLEANQMGSDVVGSAGILGGKQVMSQESSSFPSSCRIKKRLHALLSSGWFRETTQNFLFFLK